MVAATNGTHPTTELEGTVSRVNERGILLSGRPAWLNVSKFAGAVTLPDVGARVRLVLDAAGFVRACETLDAPKVVAVPAGETATESFPPVDRERLILRESVLRTAVNILATHGPVDPAELLGVAAELEAWVLR